MGFSQAFTHGPTGFSPETNGFGSWSKQVSDMGQTGFSQPFSHRILAFSPETNGF